MSEIATYYYAIFWFFCALLTINHYNQLSSCRGYSVLYQNEGYKPVLLFSLFVIIFLGFRPVHFLFGDTVVYDDMYKVLQTYGTLNMDDDSIGHSDWIFYSFMALCAQVIDVHCFFAIVICLYITMMFNGCKKLDPRHITTLMLFCFGAFSFYGYAVNGIRNGVACSFVIMALAGVCRGERLWPIILSFVAIGCHKSTALPLVCMFFTYFVRNPKMMFGIWGCTILISLSLGEYIGNLLTLLSFDERLSSELLSDNADGVEMEHKFRWDFLVYSAMPILLGAYTLFVRKIYNNTYLILIGTYIYANAFWLLAIRALFSNRIAYLSWFLYPIVIAYPLMNLPVFEKNHSQKTALILLAHLGFTTIMWMLGKS